MTEFNKDELDAPSWMNHEFFERVLKNCENDDSILVKEMKITPGSAKGDHYASVMFRAVIGYDKNKSKGNSKSLIIKTMPEVDGPKKDMLGESLIFETEISMYSKTIPKFEAVLRKIGDNTVLGAKVLYHSLKPHKCIIFEDIVPKGYETLRSRLVNMEEAKAALLKLAKWHAVSYKLVAEGDTSVTEYKEGLLCIKEIETMPLMTTGLESFIEKLEEDDELKTIIPKLRLFQKDVVARCVNSFKTCQQPGAKGIFVLCHGDFHAKNMMFKRNDKDELEDVMLVDFQICYYGPAVMDILYGMFMLFSEDLRVNHLDELIYYYNSNFINTLEKLKFQGEYPKVSDFFIDVLQHRHWEIFLLATFLPMWYGICNGVDPADLVTSDDTRRTLYDNPDYLKEAKRLLPIMLYKGYLD